MTIDALREAVARLNTAATALAAVGAVLEARIAAQPLNPAIRPHAEEILDALGLASALEGTSTEDLTPLLAEIRTLTLTNAKILHTSSRDCGWAPSEPVLMQSAGDATSRFPRALASTIAPKLEGLLPRLSSPDAAFLEVGVGVAALAIQMARTWPNLRIVGLDVWAPALALARENIRVAALEERIELREASGESIADEDAFDLAWIPSLFVPERVLPDLLKRVHRALRPGGWLLLPMLKESTDPLASSVARLRTAMWGGSLASTDEAERWLAEADFMDVRRLPAAPVAMTGILVARKATLDRSRSDC